MTSEESPPIIPSRTKEPPLTPPPKENTRMTDSNNLYRLETSDNPSTILVTELLLTENYATWSRAMQRATTDSLFSNWERCNDMVVSWLQNSITFSLRSSVAFVDDAFEIWTQLPDRFAQQNGPRIYELKKALSNLTQGEDIVSTYYGRLKTLWDELSVYDPLPTCNCGNLKIFSERYQRDSVIQFLMGLHDSYSNMRDQVMMIEPLPAVNKVFSSVQQ